jgi:septal ring factor EnvC (AmiA/AmiB activator)
MNRYINSLNIRPGGSMDNDSPLFSDLENNQTAMRRLEERIRQKDAKLEELKQNIYVYEETIPKLKKKEIMAAELSDKVGKLDK